MSRWAPVDLTGQRFDRLLVVGLSEKKDAKGGRLWAVICDCGACLERPGDNLKRTRSCGCLLSELMRERMKHIPRKPPQDLVGKRFFRLRVERAVKDDRGRTDWECRCSCGTLAVIETAALTRGKQVSCGCYSREYHRERWLQAPPAKKPRLSADVAAMRREESHRRSVDGLSDSYVAQQLGVAPSATPQSMLEAKRMHLRLVRLLKEKRDGQDKDKVTG